MLPSVASPPPEDPVLDALEELAEELVEELAELTELLLAELPELALLLVDELEDEDDEELPQEGVQSVASRRT